MKIQFEQDENEKMRNDPGNYKWGIFYFNPADSRLIVPKRIKAMGWTLNFANPYCYLVLIAIITFAIIIGNIEK